LLELSRARSGWIPIDRRRSRRIRRWTSSSAKKRGGGREDDLKASLRGRVGVAGRDGTGRDGMGWVGGMGWGMRLDILRRAATGWQLRAPKLRCSQKKRIYHITIHAQRGRNVHRLGAKPQGACRSKPEEVLFRISPIEPQGTCHAVQNLKGDYSRTAWSTCPVGEPHKGRVPRLAIRLETTLFEG